MDQTPYIIFHLQARYEENGWQFDLFSARKAWQSQEKLRYSSAAVSQLIR